jgi:chromosome segregation ATPase
LAANQCTSEPSVGSQNGRFLCNIQLLTDIDDLFILHQADVQRAKQRLQQLQQQQDTRTAALQQLRTKLTPSSPADAAPSKTGTLLVSDPEEFKRARLLGDSQEFKRALATGQRQLQQQQQDEEMQDADFLADELLADPAADADVGGEDAKVSRECAKAGPMHSSRRARGTSKHGNVRGSLRQTTLRTVIVDSSSSNGSASDADDDGSSSGSSSADEDVAVMEHTLRGKRGAAAAAPSKLPSAAALEKQTAALDLQQQQLDEQEQCLREQYALVDKSALEQDLLALQSLAAAHNTLQQLLSQHEAAATALEQLIDERYSRLLSVLQSLNAKLDSVYNQLTGGCGKAYCAYTAERRLLFSQGVTLHLQPDGNTWRRLGMLSGGQRSLATLALSFALQVRLFVGSMNIVCA